MIYILSDDNYFALGAATLLSLQGFNVHTVNINELDSFCYKMPMMKNDIILLAVDDPDLVDRILIISLAYYTTVIAVISSGGAHFKSALWAEGIIAKNIPPHQLGKAVNCIGKNNIGWLRDLTLREMEVMNELVKGKNNVKISCEMNISVKTVSAHKVSALKKLGLDMLNSRGILIYSKYRQILQHRLFGKQDICNKKLLTEHFWQ